MKWKSSALFTFSRRFLHRRRGRCRYNKGLLCAGSRRRTPGIPDSSRHFVRVREDLTMLTTNVGPFPMVLTEPFRCVSVDDKQMLRYGVRRLLEEAPDFAVVAEADNAAEAL